MVRLALKKGLISDFAELRDGGVVSSRVSVVVIPDEEGPMKEIRLTLELESRSP